MMISNKHRSPEYEPVTPFAEFPESDRQKVKNWIYNNYYKQEKINRKHTGYGMKQPLTRLTEVYLYTDQFHDAMLECKFIAEPCKYKGDRPDYHYNVSDHSPRFTGKAAV